MTQITEDYCSAEVIKLLKEKGFPFEEYKGRGVYIPSVTHALAMKWLRKKGIYINIRYVPKSDVDNIDSCYVVDIANDNTGMWVSNDIVEKNYEEAVEAALKYSLENLI